MAPNTPYHHLYKISPFTSKYSYKQIIPIQTFATITLSNETTQSPPTRKQTFSHIFQQCSAQRLLRPGKQAHGHMIISGFRPTIFVTNCLIQMYIRCSNLDCALKVFDHMPHTDIVSWNSMIFGHAGCGDMELAQSYFDSTPDRDVVSWNSLISGYMQNGEFRKSVDVFVEMGKMGVGRDHTTFAIVLKASASLEDGRLGIEIHGLAIRLGLDFDVVTGSALLDMYAKCQKLKDSLRVFNEMPEKNWVSWSAVIAGCVQNNEFISGLKLFRQMQRARAGVSQSIYASLFRSCAGLSALKLGSQLHGHALKSDFGFDIVVGTATLDMYAKCDNLADAQKLFNSLPNHSLQSYNAIIIGYVRNYEGFEALCLFQKLLRKGLGYDEITLSGALSACAAVKGILLGVLVHGLAIKRNFMSSICVANAVLDMYGKCGFLLESYLVFHQMVRRDAVSWNAVIAAHEQNGIEEETLSLFVSMLSVRMEPDEFTYGSVLKACAGQEALNYGMEIHNRIIKSGMGFNSFVGCALVDMYCKCGMMEEAKRLHNRIDQEQTMVSWNAIISGFSLQKESVEAQNVFLRMLENGVKPDNFTYATILDTCADLASIGLGMQIHAHTIKQHLQSDVYITSTIVDMYSKCGNMQDSRLMFEKAPNRDFVTWNAMIGGYAHHGLGEEALEIFQNMQLENVKPNHATFVSVLRACAHMGIVERGFHYFHSMSKNYGLEPQLEHYSCMVDIMGRSGQVQKAFELITEMPSAPDAVIWRTLLSICKLHNNVKIAEKAANNILQLDPQDSSAYILLSNIYADAGMWGEVSKIRKMMRCSGLKKEPGCSWIEVKDEVHTFLVGDKAHPKSKDIYEKLDAIIGEMRLFGYVPDIIDFVLEEEAEQNEPQQDLLLSTV